MTRTVEELFATGSGLSPERILKFAERGTFLTPPPGETLRMPQDQLWEHRRRHPYFPLLRTPALFWRGFAIEQMGPGGEGLGAVKPGFGDVAAAACHADMVLRRIGLNGYVPPPETEFVDASPTKQDERRGLRRATRHELIAALMMDVGEAEVEWVSHLLKRGIEIRREEPDAGEGRFRQVASEVMTKWMLGEPSELLLSLNPYATNKRVHDDADATLESARAEYQVERRRDRNENAPRDLRVWDLREGWFAGRYTASRERTYAEIAKELDWVKSVADARNAYQRAFRRIVGHDFSLDAWFSTVWLLKAEGEEQPGDFGPGSISSHRRKIVKSPRDVPETTLGASYRHDQNAVTDGSDRQWLSETLDDVETLLRKGHTDQEIAKELEISELAVAGLRRAKERA